MLKRIIDIAVSGTGLAVSLPVLAPAMCLVWLQDFRSPFYLAPRIGKDGRLFRMVKLRSMVIDAELTGIDSTSAQDPRITRVGHVIRRFKIDELTQLWNVLKGDMSLVGPRPNVERETARYTSVERRLLAVRPGITDFASIVFSDLGEVLKTSADPNLDYNRLVRPWKSRLGLQYVDRGSIPIDLALLFVTALAIISRPAALVCVAGLLRHIGAPDELCEVARRAAPLRPFPPPGTDRVVTASDMTASAKA